MKGAIASALNIGYGKMAIAGLEGLSYVSNDTDYKNHDGSMLVPMQGLPFDGCEKVQARIARLNMVIRKQIQHH